MAKHKTIFGLYALCALLLSALAAQEASATFEIHGRTAFTCKEGLGVGKTYDNDHCKGGTAGKFGHFSIPENTTTELTANANGGATKIKSTVAGVPVILTATGLTASGSMENKRNPEWGEHYFTSSATLMYSGVTVSGFSGKCFVYRDEAGVKGTKEAVSTETLSVFTGGHLSSMTISAPGVGGTFARFWILDSNKKTSAEGGECAIGATYTLTGGVTGTPSGATINFTHAGTTELATLQMGSGVGAKAGIEGSLALEAREPFKEESFKPISITTASTPF